MISTGLTVLLTLLCAVDMIFLCVIAYASKGKTDKFTKIGLGTMAAVVILNVLFAVGGVLLW